MLRGRQNSGEFGSNWSHPNAREPNAKAGGKKHSSRGAYLEPRDNTPTLAELGISVINGCTALRFYAEHKLGGMLKETPKAKTGPKKLGDAREPNSLAELGIDKKLSSRAQAIAELSRLAFVARARARRVAGSGFRASVEWEQLFPNFERREPRSVNS
jgi:hypothetical protein